MATVMYLYWFSMGYLECLLPCNISGCPWGWSRTVAHYGSNHNNGVTSNGFPWAAVEAESGEVVNLRYWFAHGSCLAVTAFAA